MVNGERISVTEATESAYYVKARALKSGLLKMPKKEHITTLQEVVRKYIDERTPLLSPATLRSYEANYKNRFQGYMKENVRTIDYQKMVIDELSEDLSVKSVKNAWTVIAAALKASEIEFKQPKFPQAEHTDRPFLDYEQIEVFMKAIKGHVVEPAALLALHGLRSSELLNIRYNMVDKDGIHVHGAVVRGESGWVEKSTNKIKAPSGPFLFL